MTIFKFLINLIDLIDLNKSQWPIHNIKKFVGALEFVNCLEQLEIRSIRLVPYISLPIASATFLAFFIKESNFGGVSDCEPSDQAS